ncbi:MOB-like protein phocein [Sphaceloma murrayae]|uniref:MOB-like protein phocein n=1 Tax=Sphaceloma murrayae TaxID=2082308 RepID=A0A2K1R339_9PEZI|nr:MOB-like protein phocein [Sphaceloma murrayae]
MAQSPSSSPRLPSPPPMAEDQIGPTSPGVHGLEDLDKIGQTTLTDHGASRRIRPGTKSEDMLEGPPLVELQEIDSAFQLSEHLKALFASLTTPSPNTTAPITRTTALQLSTPPPGVDRGIWLYELCRLLVARANTTLISLFSDTPACSASTCPEMRASEWQYLCAAHDPPKSCCAIDYCCHTLDWSATQLTSSKLFPSRLALGTENVTSAQQLRKMTEIFRRVYRIFAHAWFQHREVFWKVEGRSGLYLFFKTVCDEFRLIPEDSYTVPPEAEGGEGEEEEGEREREERPLEMEEELVEGRKDTQKRSHRMGMPERQNSVSTVIHEEVEEEEEELEEEEPVQRGPVVVLGTPEEEVEARLEAPKEEPEKVEQDTVQPLDGAIKEDIEVSVERSEPKTDGEPAIEPETETTIVAPAEDTSNETAASETAEPEPGKEVEAAEEDTATEPMNTEEAAAGEEDDATKTVAD